MHDMLGMGHFFLGFATHNTPEQACCFELHMGPRQEAAKLRNLSFRRVSWQYDRESNQSHSEAERFTAPLGPESAAEMLPELSLVILLEDPLLLRSLIFIIITHEGEETHRRSM